MDQAADKVAGRLPGLATDRAAGATRSTPGTASGRLSDRAAGEEPGGLAASAASGTALGRALGRDRAAGDGPGLATGLERATPGQSPGFGMIAERDIMVPMRDGTRLAVDIFRPEAPGKFPALLALSPYGKDKQSLPIPPQPPGAPLYDGGVEAGDPVYLTRHGYVHVIADTRGTGNAEGEYRGWMSRQEAQDGYDLVEWIARQPWCDGGVGMVGISYFGTVQLAVAGEQPPHLKAIMPWNAPADFYRECTHHGGVIQTFFLTLYTNSVSGGKSVSATQQDDPEAFQRLLAAARADADICLYPRIFNLLANPYRCPNFVDILIHPNDGPFYWERSAYMRYDRIKIPAYCASGWWGYAHMHLVGAFRNFNSLPGPCKLKIDPPAIEERPLPEEYNAEVVRWYDHWLKGKETGIMNEPPVKIWVMGVGRWRFEHEWPLARTQWTPYYLRRWGQLGPEPETCPGKPDSFIQQPLDETDKAATVEYATPPLGRDLEITGPIALTLHAAIDQTDTNWIVSLRDVAPNGTETELTKGFLKASHRAVDPSRSQPWAPYHPHLGSEPVAPGQVYEYAIELAPTANVFKTGHRVKLVIGCMDRPFQRVPVNIGAAHMPFHICSSKTTLHTIFHDPEHPSRLLLPVIPAEGGGRG